MASFGGFQGSSLLKSTKISALPAQVKNRWSQRLHLESQPLLAPQYTEAHIGLGMLYLYTMEYSEAIAHLQKALEINPDLEEPLYSLGIAHFKIGDKKEACFYLIKFKTTTTYLRLNPVQKQQIDAYLNLCHSVNQ